MSLNFLDDATLWVGVSFVIFILLAFRPISKNLSDSLDKKINELKMRLDESKKLKEDATVLYNEYLVKKEENLKRIKRMKSEAIKESKLIEQKISSELELALKRKNRNFNQIASQMESKITEEIKNEILKIALIYAEKRIKKNISNDDNKKLIKDSLEKISSHL